MTVAANDLAVLQPTPMLARVNEIARNEVASVLDRLPAFTCEKLTGVNFDHCAKVTIGVDWPDLERVPRSSRYLAEPRCAVLVRQKDPITSLQSM